MEKKTRRLVLYSIIQDGRNDSITIPIQQHTFREIKNVTTLSEIAKIIIWFKNCGFDISDEAYKDFTEGTWFFDNPLKKLDFYFDSDNKYECEEFKTL
jgi:hypothetical protein